MLLADSLGFLGFPGKPIQVLDELELDLVHLTAASPVARTFQETLVEIARFREEIAQFPRLCVVTNGDELNAILAVEGRTAVVLGLQHIPTDLESDHVRILRNVGIRIFPLGYYGKNQFGSGCLNLEIGLTNLGEEYLTEIARHGGILDLSHAGHQTAREALEFAQISRLPVMASHGGCYSLYPHFRNLSDDILRGIAQLGGYVGITALSFILCDERDEPSDAGFFHHLTKACVLCGLENVGVGSDCPYVSESTEDGQKRFKAMRKTLDPHDMMCARYPDYLFTGPDLLLRLHNTIVLSEPLCGDFLNNWDGAFLGENFANFLRRWLPTQ